jgi:hypothetical protein
MTRLFPLTAVFLTALAVPALAQTAGSMPPGVEKACAKEIKRLCGDAKGQGAMDCLRGNNRLSDHACKEALRSTGEFTTDMPNRGKATLPSKVPDDPKARGG